MQIHICDARPCKKQVKIEDVKQVTILGKVYDLCPECAASFEAWAKENLDNGRTPQPSTVNNWTIQWEDTTTTDIPPTTITYMGYPAWGPAFVSNTGTGK